MSSWNRSGFINKNKFLAIDSKGYDEMYVLPAKGMKVENEGLSDELVGASKAKLKTAFGKAMSGKNRVPPVAQHS
jgi:hypothetical protein